MTLLGLLTKHLPLRGVEMTTYNFTQDLTTQHFDIKVDTENHYGYFEHLYYGDEMCGGLWFDSATGKKLLDYDGVFELPSEVLTTLKAAGYDVSDAED